MASTYVNDLRLNEMATGDASGTWGTVTNTNLELIGEALGYGTEGITTNADTHTTTVADGATDPGRAMYIEYTGTLDSACTITIAPNTLNRMHFIENGTSGSQNIIIKQGSGATITIPPGDTKAVYLDGAGSGAAVVDAFASLNVVDLKVQDDLTVTDDATIGGTLGVTGVLTATSLDISGDIDVDGTSNLDVVDIDGAVDMASTLQVDGVATFTGRDIHSGGITIANAGQIGSVGDTDAIAIASDGVVTLTQKLIGTELDISGNIDVDGTTNLDVVDIDGAVDMASTLAVAGVVTANAGVVVDNFTLDGTTLALSTGSMTLDAASAIKLDADGGEVQFLDNGTEIGVVSMGSNNMNIESKQADKDILFKGVDSSSDVTALTLDMSAAGRALFNEGIKLSGLNGGTGLAFDMAGSGDYVIKESSTNDVMSFQGSLFHNFSNNRVGIGTATPASTLSVHGAVNFNTTNGDGNEARHAFTMGGAADAGSYTIYQGDGSTAGVLIHAGQSSYFVNNLGVGDTSPAYRLELPNTASSAGQGRANAWVTYSDSRIKSNIQTLSYGLDIVKQLKPSQYKHHNSIKEDGQFVKQDEGANDIGFIAQEVLPLMPEVVGIPEDTDKDLYSINYPKLTAVLTKAIQELEARVATLEG